MDKLSYRVPLPSRTRFTISEDVTNWAAENFLTVVNAVMKFLQSTDEVLDINMLIFRLRQNLESDFDRSLVKTATKYLSNEGYIKLQWMDGIKASEDRFGNHMIVICHATACFNLGPRGQIRQDFKRKIVFD